MKTSYPKLHSARPRNLENVEDFTGVTTQPVHPDRVLLGALDQLNDVVVIGWRKDGNKLHAASSMVDCPDILWLLRTVEHELLSEQSEISEVTG